MARWRVGVDSGGTFTDVCLFDEEEGRVEVNGEVITRADFERELSRESQAM